MKNLLFLNLSGAEVILVLIPLVLVGYCLLDIIRSDFKDTSTKWLWVFVILIAPVLGSLLYLLFGRKKQT